MSTRATILNANGAVCDGYTRDTTAIIKMGFPCFGYGPYGKDQKIRGSVAEFGCELVFRNGVKVQPGDIVFGDVDGVVIIP